MRKAYVLFITVLFCLSGHAIAQSFDITDTVFTTAGGHRDLPDSIINNTSSALQIKWKVIATNFPDPWIENLGICDAVSCYTRGLAWLTYDSSTYCFYAPGPATMLGYRFVDDLSASEPVGNYYLTLKLTNVADTNESKNTTVFIGGANTGITTVSGQQSAITIYPNPATDILYVDMKGSVSTVKNITIYDISGRRVISQGVSNSDIAIPLVNLVPGMYSVCLTDTDGRIISTLKFVRQ